MDRLMLLGCLTLLAPIGLALHACGLARSKNAASTVLRSVMGLCVAALAYWAVGAALLLGTGWRVLGFSPRLIFLSNTSSAEFAAPIFFYLTLVLIAVAPLAPAMGERGKMLPTGIAAAVLAGIVVPVCGYWTWMSGWLMRLRFIDIGGAGALHVAGGLFAAVGAVTLGARTGKYNTDGSANLIPGHSVPLAAVGLLVATIGWIAYLVGASVHGGISSVAALNSLLAACAATVVSYGMSRARYGKPDVLLTLGGLLAGLVSISAPAGSVTPLAAVAIGAIGAVLVVWAAVQLDMNWRIDDPGGTVATHIVAGAWSIVAVGIFTPQQNWGARFRQFGMQCLGLIVIGIFVTLIALAVFHLLKRTIGLRISEADEYDGIDLAEHDLNAYPDFQQTMIKSYHLREA